jgi:hypothetical protein
LRRGGERFRDGLAKRGLPRFPERLTGGPPGSTDHRDHSLTVTNRRSMSVPVVR